MRFLSDGAVLPKIRRLYPFEQPGYFYDGKCASLASATLSDRVGPDRMIRVTLRYARQVGVEELIGFTDRLAG